jgi:uncharacterized protein YecT (DUF1311 family)
MILLVLLLAAPAAAGSCGAEASHADRIACSLSQLSDADRRLESAWVTYQTSLREVVNRPPDGGTYAPSTEKAERQLAERYFKAAEEARSKFRAFRDAQCFSEGFPMRGGSGSDDPIIACKIRLDNAQAAHLIALSKTAR